MKENRYDDEEFFDKYSRMERSQKGLAGAGEWHALRGMLPDFQGKRVLDLGCGFGWHCRYAAEQGAAAVVGVDLSEKMLERAREMTAYPQVEYRRMAIEDVDFPAGSFEAVISSLALHYVPSFDEVCRKAARMLTPGGAFVFSVEHPIFTAQGRQDWLYGERGEKVCWPVDRYFDEGERHAVFLGETVVKYHRTVASYLASLLRVGFRIRDVAEPTPTPEALAADPSMREELRRPMMLLAAAEKMG